MPSEDQGSESCCTRCEKCQLLVLHRVVLTLRGIYAAVGTAALVTNPEFWVHVTTFCDAHPAGTLTTALGALSAAITGRLRR